MDMPPDLRAWIDRQGAADRSSLEQTWALAAGAVDPAPALAGDAWAHLAAVLDAAAIDAPTVASERASDRAAVRAPRQLWRVAAGGAVLALVVLAAAFVPVTASASGEVARVALPDGSMATLAPGSVVRYRRGLWGRARAVELSGQALFDVQTDGRPFRVETAQAQVDVLGTAFDVRAWPGAAAETAVTVLCGAVRLSGGGASVRLGPGETSVVAGGSPSAPARADTAAVVAWQRGAFSVVDAPLGAVAAAVEGRFGGVVRLGAGVDPAQRVTLFLPAPRTAADPLGDVAAYLDLRLQAGIGQYDLLAR